MSARLFVTALGLASVLVGSSANAQVRHRRPMSPAPDVRYGYDNNSGSGCRDYNCGSRCYDGHSGNDFSLSVGTPVLAGADGVVSATNNGCANYGYVGNPCGGRCGNYVQLQHSDGSRSIFCHMQLNSIAVRNGQRVRCGQTLGRSASSGSSSGPHLHFGWRRSASGASIDAFRGRCTSSPGAWVDQRSYPSSPGDRCACVASAETCNGRDDDCDGRVDDIAPRSCYTGPAGTSGRGICRAGAQPCTGGTWRACAGQVLPRAETCNRMDDDCDGRVDDGVCVMDAGAPMDAAVRDAAADVRDVTDVVDARDVTDVIDEEVETQEDASVEDVTDDAADDVSEDVTDDEPVKFDDVPEPPDGNEVSPDEPVPALEGGCGCRSGGGDTRGGMWVAGLMLAGLARRRRAR